MRLSVGKHHPRPHNSSLYRSLSFILSTALVLLPVLPAGVAHAAAPARQVKPSAALRAAPLTPPVVPLAPSLSATKVDSFSDPDGDNKAEPGQTITYTVTVTNNGPDDATNVLFTDTVDANTTLVPGSVQTQPVAANDTYSVLGNVRIQPNAAAGLLANDTDPDTGNNTGLTASGPTTSAQGGNVSVNANGSFSYNPPPGFEGTDSFTYTVTDGTQSDTATVTFNVNDVVWFVNNAAPAGGDGRLTNPYNSLASVSNGSDLDEPSDVIFVHEGTGPYDGGIVLENGQRLVGQGTSLDSALALFGISVPPHSDARPAATSNPTLANSGGNVITLNSGNTVIYLDASATAAGSSAIFGSAAGATTVGNVGVSASGTAGGVSLLNQAGSFSMSNSTVASNSSGTAVLINGGAAAISFNNTDVSQNGGRVVEVQSRAGGAVTFDAASSVAGTNGTTDAVRLVSNGGGSSVTFAGPVQLNTNAPGARGLVADSATINLTNGGNAVSATGGAAVDIENLAANVNFATTFSTDSTGRGLRVDNVSGTASFGTTTVNNSANTGVLLTDNSAALSFSDLDIAPAASVRALHATNNTGAISSTSGTVVTTSAVAVEVVGTSPASRTPLNIQLTSVSANGGLNGIVLTNTSATASPGGFNVAGNTSGACGGVANPGGALGTPPDTADCSGGRIQSTTGATATNNGIGVLLTDVEQVSLTRVHVDGHTNYGVKGTRVNGFKLNASYLHNNGDDTSGDGEGCVYFYGLTGGAGLNSITDSHLALGAARNLFVLNTSGTLDRLTLSGTTIGNDGAGGADGIFLQADNSANVGVPVTMKATVQNGRFLGSRGDGLQFSVRGTSVTDLTFTGNRMTNNHPNQIAGSTAVIISSGGASSATYNPTVTYNISNNVINNNSPNNASGTVISVGKGGISADASFVGTISGNVIGTAGVANSGSAQGSAIAVDIVGGGVHNSTITNNTIRQFTNFGIVAQSGSKNAGGGTGNLILDIRGNNIAEPSANSVLTAFPTSGIRVVTGTSAGDDHNNCVTIGGTSGADKNSIAGTGTNGGLDLRLFQRFVTILAVPGYAGANNDNAAMNAFLTARNNLTTVSATNNTGTGGPGYSSTCTAPLASLRPFANDEFASPVRTETASVTAPANGFSADRTLAAAFDKTPRGFANAEQPQALSFGSVTGFAQPEPLKAAPVAAPVTLAGETISIPIGTLKAGDSVTITFQVTVADPFMGAQPQVSNQGTVTANGGISVLTDDPSEPGATDPTVTPILLPPTVSINDATVAEPASGSSDALFTVTLSGPYTQTVTVNYQTANGGANPATAGTDYTTTSGTVTFAAGATVKTVAVPVLADGTPAEGNETFLVNLSAPTNSTIGDGQATGTITDESVASPVIISELRTSGPAGSGDDFVELLNTTDTDITVASTDGSAGWSIVKSGAGCATTPVVVGVIPNGTVIPARGNYLLVGSVYSLANYGGAGKAAGNATLSADIEDDRNVGLFTVANLANISSVNRYDAVGFGANTGDNCDLLREGNNLPAAAGSTAEYSFVRKVDKGKTQDTTDNAADFVLVSTDASVINGSPSTLGAPGPEGLANPRGPVPCSEPTGSAHFGRDLLDPAVATGSAPNTVRSFAPVANGALGTLAFRRSFTNNTGSNVTALRFRVVDLSTFPATPGNADLRVLSTTTTVVSTTSGNKTVQGTTVEVPPTQANGGGVNTSLSVGTITLGTPLAPGATVNLGFLFGIQQTGNYDIAFVLESLPGSGKDIWKLSGNTEGGHTDGGCNKPPVANAGADITAECNGGQASVTLDGSASTDPDGDTPLSYEWKEGATVLGTTQTLVVSLPTGSHTITLTVTDPSGDSSQDTVAVNVVDTQAPVVTAPADVTAFTGPGATSCGANVSNLGTATANDGCEGSLSVTATRSDSQPLNAPYPVGTTVVTYSATDGAGHTGTDTQNVTVVDNTPPTVTPPPNKVAPADPNSCSANVNPGTATASDNCSVQSINGTRSDNQPLNAPYPVGTTTITWKATDASGNTATATQTVTVTDTQAPTVSSSVAVTTMGPPFNKALINVGLSGTVFDNCSTVGPLQISVYSDEDDGSGPSHTPDAVDIGIGTLKLRRDRQGGGDGRVYLIVVKATDSSGNTAASCSTVTVPHSNSGGAQTAVNAQANAAKTFCQTNNGAAPAGYFPVGP